MVFQWCVNGVCMVFAEWYMVFLCSVNGILMVEAIVNGILMVRKWCLNGMR